LLVLLTGKKLNTIEAHKSLHHVAFSQGGLMRYPDNPPHDRPGQHDVDDRPVADTTTSEAPATSAAPATSVAPVATETEDTAVVGDRRDVVDRQKEAFGGMKFGSCFFGWLTAAGTAVLLGAIATGVGTALGLTRNVETAGTTPAGTESVGLIGGIILLAIIFVSYLAGGYVAGRMARFNGLKQGLGVWLWAVLIAILAAAAGLLAGARFDPLARVNSFPRLPLNEGTLTTGGIIVAIGVVAASLIGALLGGLAGMRYHRRVDRVGLGS
jgi:hypothetical protein